MIKDNHIRAALLPVGILGFLCCTIADTDRCIEGYTYDPEVTSCREDEAPDTGADGDGDGDVDLDANVGPDAHADTEDPDSGFGIPCTTNGNECDGYHADYCLLDPFKPSEPGICTRKDCKPGECPSGYQCCNIVISVVCLPDEGVAQAESMGGQCPP